MTHIRADNHATFRISSSGYVRRGGRPEPRTLCNAPPTDRDETHGYWRSLSPKSRESYPETVCDDCKALA